MSPNQGSRWTTWGTVSSGFREIDIGWDRLDSVGLLAPADSNCETGQSYVATAGRGAGSANRLGRDARGPRGTASHSSIEGAGALAHSV
jgi:hypothetical protein